MRIGHSTLDEMTQDANDTQPQSGTVGSTAVRNGDFQSIDYLSPPREQPMAHPAVDPPICASCQKLELQFFDPTCPKCLEILADINTTIPDIFSIIRQWTPQTQQNLQVLMREVLRRGAHVDDRDAITDMTMLQYASKAGAHGVGDVDEACRVVSWLIDRGANIYIRSRWTNMAAVHYASYFDVAPVVKLLLKASKGVVADAVCSDFDNGTTLHICATHLGIDTTRVLLQNGANPRATDDLGRIPADCVPDPKSFDQESDMARLCTRMRKMLSEAEPPPPPSYMAGHDDSHIREALKALGVKVGEKVVVGGVKNGILRYCGPTSFAAGLWAGIELDEAAGKNDGTVGGISYFKCPPKYGIFAPLSKISKPGILVNHPRPHSSPAARTYPKVNTTKVSARIDTGLARNGRGSVTSDVSEELQIGDRVLVAGQRKGVVRFCGLTEFAPGIWYGIELERPYGKNDGCVSGKRYFTCKPKHGVFAPPTRVHKLLDDHGSLESLNSMSNMQAEKARKLSVGSTSSLQSQSSISKRTPSRNIALPTLDSILESRPKGSNSMTPKRSFSTPGPIGEFKLTEGMSVFCSNELGIVRYIGPVDFSEGTWLGVELRTPKGKNDGSVQGRRYFACKPSHGLIVRPSKVTVRGINGAKLLGEHSSSESPKT